MHYDSSKKNILLYQKELQTKIANFLHLKVQKLNKITSSYGKHVEVLHSSVELSQSLLKNIEILENDIYSIEQIRRIQSRYGKKTPLYPLKGRELMSIVKNLKALDIAYRTTSQDKSPIPIDENIWGQNNTIVIFLLKNNTLDDSVDWDFANISTSNENSKLESEFAFLKK